MAMGALYFGLLRILCQTPWDRTLFIWMVLVGVVGRLILLGSTPLLENDYYRYLWDGAVVNQGGNPYQYAPEAFLHSSSKIPPFLRSLRNNPQNTLKHINHPQYRTIYPPVAQFFFSVAHILQPWSETVWRFVLLGVDILNMGLLYLLLNTLKKSPLWLVIYWWNPLLLKEIFNSGHMDILIFPFLLGALLMSMKQSYLKSSGLLALAAGVKLWPVLLWPILIRPILFKPERIVPAFLIFLGILSGLFWPVVSAGLDPTSGFHAYATQWENNSSAFKLILWSVQGGLGSIGIHPGHAQAGARAVVLFLILGGLAYLLKRKLESPQTIVSACLGITAGLFLLSPTQFPWYYVWLLPFLTLSPMGALLLPTMLLPLYYSWYYLEPRGLLDVFNQGIVWLEFIPVWIALGWAWWKHWTSEKNKTPSIKIIDENTMS